MMGGMGVECIIGGTTVKNGVQLRATCHLAGVVTSSRYTIVYSNAE